MEPTIKIAIWRTRINLPGPRSPAGEIPGCVAFSRAGLLYPRGHEAPRRMRDVDARTLARPLPARVAVPAGPPPRVRGLVQRRRGQYDLLRDARSRHGEIVGRADRPRLPVHPQAAESDHPRASPRRRRRPAPRLPGRDRTPRGAGPHPLDPAAAVLQ